MPSCDPVAVFWDYENCPAPSKSSGYELAKNIRDLVNTFGSIKTFKAYMEITKSNTVHSQLQASGVSLINCPHNGSKDVADKMMLVDMLAFAIDTPAPATIVLISGDRDFCYAISVLRQRRYDVILIGPESAHFSLKVQATQFLDWNKSLLGVGASRKGQAPEGSTSADRALTQIASTSDDLASTSDTQPKMQLQKAHPKPKNAKGPKVVPASFESLFRVLLAAHNNGKSRVRRSELASKIIMQDPEVYRRSGTSKFKAYIRRAQLDIGIVRMCKSKKGDKKSDWIELHPDWLDATVGFARGAGGRILPRRGVFEPKSHDENLEDHEPGSSNNTWGRVISSTDGADSKDVIYVDSGDDDDNSHMPSQGSSNDLGDED